MKEEIIERKVEEQRHQDCLCFKMVKTIWVHTWKGLKGLLPLRSGRSQTELQTEVH